VQFRRFGQHFYFGQFSLARSAAVRPANIRRFGCPLRIVLPKVNIRQLGHTVGSQAISSASLLGFSGASGWLRFGRRCYLAFVAI
jgi:hypothetical protein